MDAASNSLTLRVIFLLAVASAVIFAYSFHKNRYRMRCGLLFLITVFLFYSEAVLYNLSVNRGASVIFVTSLILLFLFGIGFIFFLAMLLYSGVVLLLREGVSLQNMISLILIGHVIATPLILHSASVILQSSFLQALVGVNGIVTLYLIGAAVIYVTSGILVIANPQIRPVDYVIVLGCGLLHGDKITPLLMGRVDKGISLYQKDPEHTIMIMSGGQGEDETIPEALAMKNYAVSRGVDPAHIRMEDKSVNTHQNMEFSRRIIEEEGRKNPKTAFSTNRFHQFRAGAYAYSCGMNIRGVGSRTKYYYELTASVREYVALLARDWRKHTANLLILVIPFLLSVFSGVI